MDRASLTVANVRLIDVADGRVGEACDLWIDRGRVAELRPHGTRRDGTLALDGGGRFALPGLIDSHCHACGVFLPELPGPGDAWWMPRQLDLNLRASARSGVTTMRDLMAPLRVVRLLRGRARHASSGWPRLLCSGPMLTVPGGYPAFVPRDTWLRRKLAGPLRVDLTGAADARHWVDRLAEMGVDCIKVGFASRGLDDRQSPIPAPSADLMRAIVDAAHGHGLPVAVHHGWASDLQKLVELPFDTLEHLTMDSELDAALVERIARRGLPVTTNLEVVAWLDQAAKHLDAINRGIAPLLPVPGRRMAQVLRGLLAGKAPARQIGLEALHGAVQRMAKNLERLVAGGVKVAAGTDAGMNLCFGSLPDEICSIARAVGPKAALRAATLDAARVLGLGDVGRLAPGCRADLVLYDENPLGRIETLRKPVLVMRDGVALSGALPVAFTTSRGEFGRSMA